MKQTNTFGGIIARHLAAAFALVAALAPTVSLSLPAELGKNVYDAKFTHLPANVQDLLSSEPDAWNFNFRAYGSSSDMLWTDPSVQRNAVADGAADKRPTALHVSADEEGFTVLVLCVEPSLATFHSSTNSYPAPSLEFFFLPGSADEGGIAHHYMMYYGNFTLNEYAWLVPTRDFRYMRPYTKVSETALKNSIIVRLDFAWEGIFDKLTFLGDDEGDSIWRLSMIRWAPGGGQTWGGVVHQQSRAGYVRWHFTREEKTAIMKSVLDKAWIAFRKTAASPDLLCDKSWAGVNTDGAKYFSAMMAADPRSFVNYNEDPAFRPILEALEAERNALAPAIGRFLELPYAEQVAFYEKASRMLFNYRYDVEDAYAALESDRAFAADRAKKAASELVKPVDAAPAAAATAPAAAAKAPETKDGGQSAAPPPKPEDRARALIKSLESTYGENKGKNWEKAEAELAELRSLVALKEDAPQCIDGQRLHFLAAKVYSRPLDLRHAAAADKEFQAAIAGEKNADMLARMKYDYAKFRLASALDDDPEKWEKAMADALSTPGVSAITKLDLLDAGVPGLDFATEGRKVADGDAAVRTEYYRRLTDPNRFYGGRDKSLDKVLRKDFSCERLLELCDEALARTEPRDAPTFIGRKSVALTRLERFEEAEQLLLTSAAITNAYLRRTYLGMLGEFYAGRAERYYTGPYVPMLRKALRAYQERLELDPRNGGFARAVVDTAMKTGDWELAKLCLDNYCAVFCPNKTDSYAARYYGDAYYGLGEYDKACEFYGMYDMPKSRSLPDSNFRYAEALYACGRYAEALAQLDKFPTHGAHRGMLAAWRKSIEEKMAEKR